MAKSTSRTRRPSAAHAEPEVQEQPQQPAETATAVESAPAPARPEPARNDESRSESRGETRRENRGESRDRGDRESRDNNRDREYRDRGDRDRDGGGVSAPPSDDVASLDAETNAKYEQVKGGKLYIRDLQQMDIHGLHEIAKQEGIPDYIGMKKQDLIFQILRSRIRQNGLMYGEGVLEILPDGFGFLRSPEYNYLPCPDDIYISPSQIRRFGLRNGHVVQGQIRPPRESERYFALLRVEAINGEDPEKSTDTGNFEDLTPLHPNRRIILETDPKEQNMRIVDLVTPIGMS